MDKAFDVAVVGAGIVGLSHAWMAARRGLRVALIERSAQAQGATIRNFGMVWPIGQPPGELYATALRSREFWLELAERKVIEADQCGSVHLAHHDDELAVLDEFQSQNTHECELLSGDEILQRAPIANPNGLRGGLWSPTELRVDPRSAASRIAAWLEEVFSVTRFFGASVVNVAEQAVIFGNGEQIRARRVVICSGSDLVTLYPEVFEQSGLRLCKLQMLRTAKQPSSCVQSAHIASGLTLRHYQSFESCPTLPKLKQRIAVESPELDRYGIHVMASQAANGEFILGDSHEYDDEITPFDKPEIDELILGELRKIIQLPDWSIRERWHGVYARLQDAPVFSCSPESSVHVCVGTGGAGMTMSFGLANQFWTEWMGPEK